MSDCGNESQVLSEIIPNNYTLVTDVEGQLIQDNNNLLLQQRSGNQITIVNVNSILKKFIIVVDGTLIYVASDVVMTNFNIAIPGTSSQGLDNKLDDVTLRTAWVRNDILKLINLFKKYEPEFKSTSVKNDKVWKQISNELLTHTAEQCKNKFKYLKQKYIEKQDNMKPTSSGARAISFEYFELFDEMFGKDPNVTPKYIASSTRGRNNMHLHNTGEDDNEKKTMRRGKGISYELANKFPLYPSTQERSTNTQDINTEEDYDNEIFYDALQDMPQKQSENVYDSTLFEDRYLKLGTKENQTNGTKIKEFFNKSCQETTSRIRHRKNIHGIDEIKETEDVNSAHPDKLQYNSGNLPTIKEKTRKAAPDWTAKVEIIQYGELSEEEEEEEDFHSAFKQRQQNFIINKANNERKKLHNNLQSSQLQVRNEIGKETNFCILHSQNQPNFCMMKMTQKWNKDLQNKTAKSISVTTELVKTTCKKKDLAWAEIGKLLGYTDEECKRRWLYLREKYVKEKNGKSSGSEAVKQWDFFNSLRWLDMHIMKRKTKSNCSKEMQETTSQESQSQDTIEICQEDFSINGEAEEEPIASRSPVFLNEILISSPSSSRPSTPSTSQ
ncbi:hypothetical protein RN001_005844 [Aquatica leii]|uniref:Uncharacterized protein n=1 Tax=Aquatica leii TaxID=1421715 RepID=A0AAN7SS51_9COLE|nr:hypothetical protein RN001_005844 [Aquatica leii]